MWYGFMWNSPSPSKRSWKSVRSFSLVSGVCGLSFGWLPGGDLVALLLSSFYVRLQLN